MSNRLCRYAGAWVPALSLLLCGCGGSSKAKTIVQVRYELAPTKTLPAGMKTLAVLPAETTEEADAKWSNLASNMVYGLLTEANERFDQGLRFTERTDVKKVFDEKDLTLSGIADGSMATAAAKLLAAEGLVCSKIAVRVETHKGKTKTLKLGGLHGFHGMPNVRSEEAEKVKRNIMVQCTFKLIDAATGRAWTTYVGDTLSREDEGKPSAFYGSDMTEADLTPSDQIVGQLVEKEVRRFVGQLVPCQMTVDVPLKSSSSEVCARGVKLVAAGEYESALASFQEAMQEDPKDHRAAFGAGVACEKMGKYDEAVAHYKQALLIDPKEEYIDAKKRVEGCKDRVWQG